MDRRVLILTFIILVTGLFTGSQAMARFPGLPGLLLAAEVDIPEHKPGGPKDTVRIEQIRKRIGMVRMWRLTKYLDLDEATAAKLFPAINRYDKKRMALERERFSLIREVRKSSKQPPDDAVSKNFLEKLEQNQAALQELRRKQHEEIKKILSLWQMTRYLVFEQKFEQEIRDIIHEIRKEHGGRRVLEER